MTQHGYDLPSLSNTASWVSSLNSSSNSLTLLTPDQAAGTPGARSRRTPSIASITWTSSASLLRKSKGRKKLRRELRDAFSLFDKDGDGAITKEELGSFMQSIGQFATPEELTDMLKDLDINGDGKLSFDEFVDVLDSKVGCSKKKDTDTGQEIDWNEEKELREAFRVFDRMGHGYISCSDLRAVIQCMGEDLSDKEIEDMIREVDVDGDGRINFEEFVRALGEPDNSDDDDEDDEDTDTTAAVNDIDNDSLSSQDGSVTAKYAL